MRAILKPSDVRRFSYGTQFLQLNNNIHCTVASCAHHNQPNNCCSLQSIRVGCSDSSPTRCEGTECASFQLK